LFEVNDPDARENLSENVGFDMPTALGESLLFKGVKKDFKGSEKLLRNDNLQLSEAVGFETKNLADVQESIILPFDRRPSTQKSAVITSARILDIIREFNASKVVPRFCFRDPTIAFIQREAVNALLLQDYTQADEWNSLNARFLATVTEVERKELSIIKNSNLDARICECQSAIADMEADRQDQIEEEHRKCAEKLDLLEKRHKAELREFRKFYDNVGNLREYSKPSGFLLHLRARERSMVMCSMFDDAKVISKEAAVIEREEADVKQGKVLMEIRKRKKILRERQNREAKRVIDYHEKVIEQIKINIDRRVKLMNSRIAVLEQVKKKGPSISYYSGDQIQTHGMRTPRTRERFDEFKRKPPVGRLVLNPVRNLAWRASKRRNVRSRTRARDSVDF
jgi:hypothetical protein